VYRILTERKNIDLVRRILGQLGLDYTLYCADGVWRGKPERSVIIELEYLAWDIAELAARRIGQLNCQEAVLLQDIPVTGHFLIRTAPIKSLELVISVNS
jgi:hypothetical protein